MDFPSNPSGDSVSSEDDLVSDNLSTTSSALQELMDNELEDAFEAIDLLQMHDMSDDFQEAQMRRYKWPSCLSSSVCLDCSKMFTDPMNTKALVDGEGFPFAKVSHDQSCPLCYLLGRSSVPDTNHMFRVHRWKDGSSLLSSIQIANEFGAETFEILGPAGEDGSPCFGAEPINRNFKSPACFNRARQWIRKCCETHTACGRKSATSSQKPPMPTRVIDVSDPSRPFLHVTGENDTSNYVALSYCWGGDQPFKTTTGTFERYCKHLPESSLPQSIKDAIECTHQLGVDYLWIDSLCIIQDDPGDVAAELLEMASIYQNALVTLAAANTEKCTDGFLEERTALTLEFTIPFALPDTGTVVDAVLRDSDIGKWREPLWERAWTFQEMMLSPRVLIYGVKQLYWKCQETFFSDGGQTSWEDYCHYTSISTLLSPRAFHEGGSETKPSSEMRRWRGEWLTVVNDYSSRNLTVPTDKLPAISAIARVMGMGQRSNLYVAGLWRDSLLDDLMWRVARQGKIPDMMPYRAPSWSWASAYGIIQYDDPEEPMYDGHEERHYHMVRRQVAQVVNCDVSPASSDPYGQIKDGRLVIEGKVKPVDMQYLTGFVANIISDATESESSYSEPDDRSILASVTLDGPKEINTDFQQTKSKDIRKTTIPVICLVIHYRGTSVVQAFAQGLVLKEARRQGAEQVYQRIGIFECIDTKESKFFNDAELKTVAIV